MTEAEILEMIKVKFPPPEYAFLPHVRNGTGFSRSVRTADALVFSLYPSRGLELHGFEIKCSRNDWVREKNDPDKAEEIARFCDRWWICVSGEKIIQPGELPANWGLIVPTKAGLRVRVQAQKLQAQPITRLMLASIMRRVYECSPMEEALEKAKKEAFERGKAEASRNMPLVERRYEELK